MRYETHMPEVDEEGAWYDQHAESYLDAASAMYAEYTGDEGKPLEVWVRAPGKPETETRYRVWQPPLEITELP